MSFTVAYGRTLTAWHSLQTELYFAVPYCLDETNCDTTHTYSTN